jgi:diphthamide biosynthesis protein 3
MSDDAQSHSGSTSVAVYEEVPFEELDYAEEDDMFYYQCPCGDMFEISRVRHHPASQACWRDSCS